MISRWPLIARPPLRPASAPPSVVRHLPRPAPAPPTADSQRLFRWPADDRPPRRIRDGGIAFSFQSVCVPAGQTVYIRFLLTVASGLRPSARTRSDPCSGGGQQPELQQGQQRRQLQPRRRPCRERPCRAPATQHGSDRRRRRRGGRQYRSGCHSGNGAAHLPTMLEGEEHEAKGSSTR